MMFGTMHSKQRQAGLERQHVFTSAQITEAMHQPTRAELREMLTEAVKNTAAMTPGEGA